MRVQDVGFRTLDSGFMIWGLEFLACVEDLNLGCHPGLPVKGLQGVCDLACMFRVLAPGLMFRV